MIFNVIKQSESLVKLAQAIVESRISPGATVIDTTVGNGHDTRFLLAQVQPDGLVYGFDIQQAAINSTLQSLQVSPYYRCLKLFHASHNELLMHIPQELHGQISAVMFNLGYLPGGDKSITTQADSTLTALSQASQLLAIGGVLTVLAYPGHAAGATETEQVNQWCLNLTPEKFESTLFENSPGNPAAPKLFTVNKLA